MPLGAASFDAALEMTAEVYRAAGELMRDAGKLAGVADEGGWWPAFDTNEEALDWLVRAIERAGFAPGAEVAISLDIAASEFGRGGTYRLGSRGPTLDRDGMSEMLERWLARYPIVSIEDPLAEDDAEGLARSRARWARACRSSATISWSRTPGAWPPPRRGGACNAVLIKPNQAGTVTEAKAALDGGQARGLRHHRVGAFGRNRGRRHRAPRGGVGRRAAQGRLVRTLRAHGEVERGAADRSGGGRERALRRARGAAAVPVLTAVNVARPYAHLTYPRLERISGRPHAVGYRDCPGREARAHRQGRARPARDRGRAPRAVRPLQGEGLARITSTRSQDRPDGKLDSRDGDQPDARRARARRRRRSGSATR